jgi:hypothetical protein
MKSFMISSDTCPFETVHERKKGEAGLSAMRITFTACTSVDERVTLMWIMANFLAKVET